MESYKYKHWEILRKDKTIIITDSLGKLIYKAELSPKKNVLGKINIPLSNLCTMKCIYCSEYESNKKEPVITSIETAEAVIDSYFRFIVERENIQSVCLSFDYGGEPMCMFRTLVQLSHYFRRKCETFHKHGVVQMTTNGVWHTELVDDVLNTVDEVIFSIDGYKELHDKYRRYKSEKSGFDLIVKNARMVYKAGKLKQISSVITVDTISNCEKYAKFFLENFPGTTIKTNAVIITEEVKSNGIEKIPYATWNQFIDDMKQITQGSIEILNSKPDKDILLSYSYGCEHMQMINWFYWLNGTITCCMDREMSSYVIGILDKNRVNMNQTLMESLESQNYIENISKCRDCFAKYYCSGGCPKFRNDGINCDRRRKKYAKLLIERARL